MLTVVIGGLLVLAIKQYDYKDDYKRYRDVFTTEEKEVFKVESSQLAAEIAKRWKECRYGIDNMSFSVFVTDEAAINRSMLVRELLRVDKCDVIDCRNNTNKLHVASIQAPKIINIRCFNSSLIVQ